MSLTTYCVRRATVDDLPGLLGLWTAMNFPALELERRLTEFQLVETEDGNLLGALGIEIIGRQGRLHSEAFNDFGLAENLRERLWERLRSIATHQGLARLWTAETAPFWKQNGFLPAEAEALKKLPANWTSLSCHWLTLALRDEEALRATLETEFGRLKAEEKQRLDQVLRRAKIWKFLGIALAVAVALAAIVFSVYLLRHLPHRARG